MTSDSRPPDKQEITKLIRNLKNNKAAAGDAIVTKLLTEAEKLMIEALKKYLTYTWEKGQFPVEWKCALIHLLHKKVKRADTNNDRGSSFFIGNLRDVFAGTPF